MLHVPLSMTALFYKQLGLTACPLFFGEFSLFVNIKYLHNKLNQAFLIYFVYTEKQTEFFNEFVTKI